MSDLVLIPIWTAALIAGVTGCLVLRAAGVATTYVRDLLHVGAGVWVLGWPLWTDPAPAVALVAAVAAVTALVPTLAPRSATARSFAHSVASGDEHYDGLIWYTLSYTGLTAAGLYGEVFPAAAALLCLSLGDGIGGAVGRRFGRNYYVLGDAKPKTLEGSFAVFAAATIGVGVAGVVAGAPVTMAAAVAIAAVATLAEAASPRGLDNAFVPAAAFVAAHMIT